MNIGPIPAYGPKPLQRYDPDGDDAYMDERRDGEWVSYDDHLAIYKVGCDMVAAKDAEVESWKATVESVAAEREYAKKKLAEAMAVIDRLREEGKRDYDSMREMQAKFMKADHSLRDTQAELARLREENDRFRKALTIIDNFGSGHDEFNGSSSARTAHAAITQPAKSAPAPA